MGKGIIVASFGTSYERTRKLSIESVEDDIRDEFREIPVERAFTSRIIISRLKKRDGLDIFTEKEAVEKYRKDGIEDIYIQPLHIISGHEYEKISSIEGVTVGAPLLTSDEDYKKAVEAVNSKDLDGDVLIFMGHGTNHEADVSYERLEREYRDQGYENVFVATVEGERTIEDVLVEMEEKNYKKIILQPFMLVAGDHATNDMASDEDDSWKTILEAKGYEVETRLKGLGEYQGIRNIYIDHLKDIMEEK